MAYTAWYNTVRLQWFWIVTQPSCFSFFFRCYSRDMCWGGGERERLPSFTASHRGGKNQTSRTEEEGWRGRQKRGEDGERRGEVETEVGQQKKEGRNRGRKDEEKKLTWGVGWERREGQRRALAAVFNTWVISSKSFSNAGQRSSNPHNSWHSQDLAAHIKSSKSESNRKLQLQSV